MRIPGGTGCLAWSNGTDIFLLHSKRLPVQIARRSKTLLDLHETPGTVAELPFTETQVKLWLHQAETGHCALSANTSLNAPQQASTDAGKALWDRSLDDLQVRLPQKRTGGLPARH